MTFRPRGRPSSSPHRPAAIEAAATRTTLDESPSVDVLYDWLEQNECEGFEATYIGLDEQTRLRGLYASQALEAGEYIVGVPFGAAFVIDQDDSGAEGTVNGASFDPDVLRGLGFLRAWKKNNTRHSHEPLLDCLPRLVETPDVWPTEVVEELQIPTLVQDILRLKNDIVRLCSATSSDINTTVDELQYATWIIRSRGFTTLKVTDGDKVQSRTLLLPLIDMINHDAYPNAVLEVIDSDHDDESFFALQATRRIEQDEQITIAYGTGMETSIDLLSKYGFWTTDDANWNLDWDLVDPQWTTSVQEDEDLLETCDDMTMQTVIRFRIHLKRQQLLYHYESESV